MTEVITVVVVDDHELFRQGVIHTLNDDDCIEVVGAGGSADEALALAQELLPDLILLDISMPGGGINAASAIAAACPVVRIAMLTVSEFEDDVMAALQAGARGYILKGIGGGRLVEVIKGLCEGETYVSPDLAARLLTQARARPREDTSDPQALLSTLTSREEQILELVAQGLSNKEIGLKLDIREKTVKHYMTNVLQKLQVRNRVEAALMAREHLKTF